MADNRGEKSKTKNPAPPPCVSPAATGSGCGCRGGSERIPIRFQEWNNFYQSSVQGGRRFVTLILVSTPGGIINTFLYLKWNGQQTGFRWKLFCGFEQRKLPDRKILHILHIYYSTINTHQWEFCLARFQPAALHPPSWNRLMVHIWELNYGEKIFNVIMSSWWALFNGDEPPAGDTSAAASVCLMCDGLTCLNSHIYCTVGYKRCGLWLSLRRADDADDALLAVLRRWWVELSACAFRWRLCNLIGRVFCELSLGGLYVWIPFTFVHLTRWSTFLEPEAQPVFRDFDASVPTQWQGGNVVGCVWWWEESWRQSGSVISPTEIFWAFVV